VRFERGYTIIELLVVLGMITILAGVSVPVFIESSARNRVWTGAELIGANIRQARLKAISRNATFRVQFDCPRVGSLRVLAVTGEPLVDEAADRCDTFLLAEGDSGELVMPQGVTFGAAVPTLEVNGRGLFTAIGGAVPQTITITNGSMIRIVRVSAAGQISFRTEAEEVADEEPE
jgi:prepilin-type N-terminal cleavage/methylation domain-containing protein